VEKPKLPSAKELRRNARERFLKARKAEAAYQRQLTTVGKQIGALVKGYAPTGAVTDLPGLMRALQKYSEIIQPWARSVTASMHRDVAQRDASSWAELSHEMGKALRMEIMETPVRRVLRDQVDRQAKLISSLPIDAAVRVRELTIRAMVETAGRADELAKEILRSGQVSIAHAKLIARTETSRTGALLTEARAGSIGSTHYRWHTSEDSDVRPDHKALNKKVFRWDDPPYAGSGMRYNPGCGPNCRCWAEPILPD